MFFVILRRFYKNPIIVSSKSILLTGLALGNKTNMCPCSDIHTDWIFEDPQDLLWADNIILTIEENNIINQYEHSDNPYNRAVWIIFQYLKDARVIQIIEDDIISEDIANLITKQVVEDILLINPKYLEEEIYTFTYKKHHYCEPALRTLYAAIMLSYKLDCTISLSSGESQYLQDMLLLKYNKVKNCGKNLYINKLMQSYLPQIELGHHYIYRDIHKQCKSCRNIDTCKLNHLDDIEKQIKKILIYREREEIRQLSQIIDNVIDNDFSNATLKDIEFYKKQIETQALQIQQKINYTFKGYTKWKSLATYASIGLTAAGITGDNTILTAIGGAGNVLEKVVDNIMSVYQKKNSWVNLVTERMLCDKTHSK